LDEVCQLFAAGRWFSPGTPASSTNDKERISFTNHDCRRTTNSATDVNFTNIVHSDRQLFED
jgi:hypothetical protein